MNATPENVKQLMRAFLAIWPEAENGPGHIVLGDDNMGNGHIQWCLNLADAVLGQSKDPTFKAHAKFLRYFELGEQTHNSIWATRLFLELLLLIPEDTRYLWE